MISGLVALGRSQITLLKAAYDQSNDVLRPLSDPLTTNLFLHRQLCLSREEVYSDWLQWILNELATPELVGQVLNLPRISAKPNSERIYARRERGVRYGYSGHKGRVDIVLEQDGHKVAVIEVKTRPYEDEDLEKHAGYKQSMRSAEIEFLFLAVEAPDIEKHGFRFLAWTNVCIALRAIARKRLSPEQALRTALLLAFVGAVEQNLLGFVSPDSGTDLRMESIPRTLDHLTRANNWSAHDEQN